MEKVKCFNNGNLYHMVLQGPPIFPSPTFFQGNWKEVDMNDMSGGSGVEGPAIAPPSSDKISERPKRPTNLHEGTKNEFACEIFAGKFIHSQI